MLQTLVVNILALIVTLGILVTIHEFGHFWVARRCGVKVLRFSIGFGKAVKTWVGKDGCEYVIAPIPLGGYVKMLGQDDTRTDAGNDIHDDERHMSFNYKPLWQRFAIVAAGPLANFLLAILVFWLINITYGQRGVAPVIGSILPESPAWQVGLRAGDEIVSVDGNDTTLWQHVTMAMLDRLGETGQLQITAIPAGQLDTREYTIPLNSWQSSSAAPDPLGSLGIVQFDIPPVLDTIVAGGRCRASWSDEWRQDHQRRWTRYIGLGAMGQYCARQSGTASGSCCRTSGKCGAATADPDSGWQSR